MSLPHLSASQLNTYLACGQRWVFQYVDGKRSPTNGYMVRGLALDEAANLHYRSVARGGDGLSAAEFVEAAVSNHQAKLVGADDVELEVSEVESRAIVERASRAYHAAVATKLKPRSVADVQRKYTVQVDGAFEVIGYVDLILESGAVVDNKLKRSLASEGELAGSVQLSTYAWMTGATNLALAVAQPTGRATIQWTTRDAADVERVQRLYSRVWASIQLGVAVPASPEAWNCSPKWCPFWAECEFGGKR